MNIVIELNRKNLLSNLLLTLFLSGLFFTSCRKERADKERAALDILAGTYSGVMRDSGKWVYVDSGIINNQIDTSYSSEIIVTYVGTDSIAFQFIGIFFPYETVNYFPGERLTFAIGNTNTYHQFDEFSMSGISYSFQFINNTVQFYQQNGWPYGSLSRKFTGVR